MCGEKEKVPNQNYIIKILEFFHVIINTPVANSDAQSNTQTREV